MARTKTPRRRNKVTSSSPTSTPLPTPSNPNQARPSTLKILSVNACCLPSGLRNARLPSDTVRAGFGVHFLLFFVALFYYHTHHQPLSSQSFTDVTVLTWAIPVFFACFLPGWVLGGQAARLVGKCRMTCLGWGTDYKIERLQFLAEHVFPAYEVIAIQELFASFPNVLDAGHVDCLIGYAAKQGFVHVARPGHAAFPSIAMNTGLLILSKYPIEESVPLVFSHQFIGEQFAVNRGAMYAKIVYPSSKGTTCSLHFFTAHVSPSMRNLLRGYPEQILTKGDEARTSQFQQLGSFIQSKWNQPGTDGRARAANMEQCVVAGDFNADITFPSSTVGSSIGQPVPGDAMHIVLKTLVNEVGLCDTTNGNYVPTFGYMGKEHLLTNVGARETFKTDDLIFCDANTYKNGYRWSSVSLSVEAILNNGEKVPQAMTTPFTHLSDHWGVEFVLPCVEK